MFKVGSAPQILGRITASPANCATKGLLRGSLVAVRSQNGEYLVRVPTYGFMGNVRCCASIYTFAEADLFPSYSGCREGNPLVR
jgi:hypothetical protein